MKLLVSALVLAFMMILGNANYHLEAQTSTTNMNLAFMTVPQKLIADTDATLLIYAVDSSNTPMPIRIPTLTVTSSDPSVISVNDVTSSEFDNSVKVSIHAGKIGSATLTAASQGFLSSQVKLDVVGDAYKPSGLLVKATPSTFSQYGPYKGYVSVQLVNFFGNTIPTDQDLVINLSSSDPNVIDLDQQVIMKQGEYFVHKEFTVLNSGITLLQAEIPGMWKESAKVNVLQPTNPLQIALKVFPDIAPARQGALLYAFAQLQDANGLPLKASTDIPVNIITDSNDIRQGTGLIKKGQSHTVVTLSVNTSTECPASLDENGSPRDLEFDPCVTLTAVAKGYRTGPAEVELRTPVDQEDINPDTRIFDPRASIEPVVYSVPLLADGKDQFIGVVQLQTTDEDGLIDRETTQPVIASIDLPISAQSSDSEILEIKGDVRMQRSKSVTLLEGTMGYKTGNPEVVIVAEFFGESVTPITVTGHSGVVMAAEPVISKILSKTTFPMVVYFKDAGGASSYAPGDMLISISHLDVPEAEIGTSTTTTDILDIQSAAIQKGSSIKMLQTDSKGKGTSTVTFESSMKDATFSTQTSIVMGNQVPENLGMFIPATILGNAKYTVPLQVIDKNGYPIKTTSDVEIMLVPSIRNVISTPASVIIPKGQYYATMLIEAISQGSTEVTALANNFQSSKINVQVTTAKPEFILTPSVSTVRLNDQFTVTLDSKYLGMPLKDIAIRWSSDAAILVEGDEKTDENGKAEAVFLINRETPFAITAEAEGYGYERSATSISLSSVPQTPVNTVLPDLGNNGQDNSMISYSYFLVLPAIGGVIFWLIKTERLNLPFGRLLERFRGEEE